MEKITLESDTLPQGVYTVYYDQKNDKIEFVGPDTDLVEQSEIEQRATELFQGEITEENQETVSPLLFLAGITVGEERDMYLTDLGKLMTDDGTLGNVRFDTRKELAYA